MTIDYVNLVERSFGPNIGALKGKITRRKLKTRKDGIVGIPTELIEQNKNLTHCMEIMFVNDMPMITGINRNISYQYLVFLNIRSEYDLYKIIDENSDITTKRYY